MDLKISSLLSAYRSHSLSPRELFQSLILKMEKTPNAIWIQKISQDQLDAYLKVLEAQDPESLPLYGIPFAIKDNIDCEGFESTAACPAYAYRPSQSAFVVERLIKLGAVPLGKTNMDQFATGLVGVRTPYGSIPNKFAPEYISGGSSSGSAAALAYELCSFSLGTDTAGSGRVPAAYNNLVGVKPTRGLLSTNGVIPACKSLDCVSIFALNPADARYVFHLAVEEDPEEPYSRIAPWKKPNGFAARLPESWTFGVPEERELEFFGNAGYKKAFDKAVQIFEKAGGKKVTIHFTPFLEAARLLYEGPWVFERYDAVGKFIEAHPNEIHPVTKAIISPKTTPHPSQVFAGFHALQAKKKIADQEFSKVDFILTPTAGTIYKTAEVAANPIQLNSNLGYYTNYMNLLDYSALAIPAGKATSTDPSVSEFPFGVTLVGKAFDDFKLLDVAEKVSPFFTSKIEFAVCGAHLKGEPLHGQLESAEFIEATTTAPEYTMFAFQDGNIPKPALVSGGSTSFYVEVYAFSPAEFGKFVENIPAPLSMGKIKLSNGKMVSGFIGDTSILQKADDGLAKDISFLGDWRKYRLSL